MSERVNAFPESHPQPDDGQDACDSEVRALLPALEAYVFSLLLDRDAMEEVVQETFLFVWERRRDLRGEDLRAYSFRTAWFKALTHRRTRQRSKIVHFSEEMLQRIAGAAERQPVETDSRLSALRVCIQKLKPKERELLDLKYVKNLSVSDHARKSQLSVNRLQKTISRIRIALRHCIESSLHRYQ